MHQVTHHAPQIHHTTPHTPHTTHTTRTHHTTPHKQQARVRRAGSVSVSGYPEQQGKRQRGLYDRV